MKIFEKVKKENGKRQVKLLGKVIFCYNKGLLKNIFSIRKHYDWTCTYLYMTILGFKFIIWPRYMMIYAKRFKKDLSLKDKKYILEYQFKRRTGYKPNIDNPETFNEKLQWLKLYYHNPVMTTCADKYSVKSYVSEKVGAEHVVPLLGVWDKPEDIEFDKLPNQFVLKTTWGCGNNLIVKDKSKLNIEETRTIFKKWLNIKKNHYYLSFEWGYKNIVPRIIAEEYVGELGDNLTCYKIFNFNSKPYLIQAVFDDKTSYETINYYDLNWNKLDLRQNFPNNENEMPKPKNLDKMLKLSEKLAQEFPYFVRVDFYEFGNKVLFSEFTFYSDNGMAKFQPEEWDKKLGKLIHLPTDNKSKVG